MNRLAMPVLILVCVVILLVVAGSAYQTITWALDAHRSPEPGTRVDVGGYRLKINCIGTGSPTVILESGLGDLSVEWNTVQTQVAKSSRVCSYDRAGYGGSDSGPMPRTSAAIASELHSLLQNAGEKPPFVLVGHSFGGYNVRVFNARYPKEVAGIVLADSPQEDQYQLLPTAWKVSGAALTEHYRHQARTAPLFVGLGIARLKLQASGGLQPYDYLILQSKYLKARASELENIQVSAAQARAAGPIGNKPLIVLAAGKNIDVASLGGLSQQDVDDFQRIWLQDLQPRLAHLSTHSKLLIVRSGHNIPAEFPEAIAEAVRELLRVA